MNQAILENLFQIAAPPRDAGTTARSRNDAPPFDSLFRQVTEPQSRSSPTDSPSQSSFSTGSTEPQPVESKASTHDDSTASQSAPSNDDSEYATETAATSQDEHDDRESEVEEAAELGAAEAAAAAPVTATEPQSEVALNDELEQLAGFTTDAALVDAKENGDANRQLAATDAPVGVPAVPTSDATSKAEAIEETATEVTEAANSKDETKPTAKTSELHATATTHTAAAASQETKGDSRPRTKNIKDESVAEDQPKPTNAAVSRTDKPHELHAAEVATADQPTAAASTEKEPEAQPTVQRSDSRFDARSDEKPTAVAATTDQPFSTRPAAATTAPIAATVQQRTQSAATKTTTTTDAAAKPDAVRAKDTALSPFARLERNQAGATRGANGTHSQSSTPHVDPTRFISRVARAINTAQERGAPLQLRLSPPELGAMRIELSVNQGALTATIETDNTAARQVLLENLPALRERLAEQNVKIERFDVDVRQDGSGQQNPAAQQQNDGTNQHRAATRGQTLRNATSNVATSDEPAPVRRTITSSSINVIA